MEINHGFNRVDVEKDHAAMTVDLKLVQREGPGGVIFALGVKLPYSEARTLGTELLRLAGDQT